MSTSSGRHGVAMFAFGMRHVARLACSVWKFGSGFPYCTATSTVGADGSASAPTEDYTEGLVFDYTEGLVPSLSNAGRWVGRRLVSVGIGGQDGLIWASYRSTGVC